MIKVVKDLIDNHVQYLEDSNRNMGEVLVISKQRVKDLSNKIDHNNEDLIKIKQYINQLNNLDG